MRTYTLDDLAKLIDHSNLMPNVSADDMRILCNEARAWSFASVAVNQAQVGLCHELLQDCDVRVCAAISFPLGQTSLYSKIQDTRDAIESGADEIDYVINLTEVKNGNWDYVRDEMESMMAICREGRGGGALGAAQPVVCKVIFENCYLSEGEKITLCEMASEVGPNFIKTSTGFGPTGATLEDVRLMREHAAPEVGVKAAGGIRSVDDFCAFARAGATRIGTSAGVSIIEDLAQRLRDDATDSIEL